MVDFWINHFNVFVGKGQVRVYLTEYERDAIRPHVLGKFRDLLGASAAKSRDALLSRQLAELRGTRCGDVRGRRADARRAAAAAVPARPRAGRPGAGPRPGAAARAADQPMRDGTQPPQAARRRGLNENYARELMELHTLGVDGGYTQKDVQEVARAFTGWTIANPRAGGDYRFEPRLHDDGEKVVLGHRIKAGGGKRDGDEVLDLLARHPSTARFIATKLARRFVADEPPPALVDAGRGQVQVDRR